MVDIWHVDVLCSPFLRVPQSVWRCLVSIIRRRIIVVVMVRVVQSFGWWVSVLVVVVVVGLGGALPCLH